MLDQIAEKKMRTSISSCNQITVGLLIVKAIIKLIYAWRIINLSFLFLKPQVWVWIF